MKYQKDHEAEPQKNIKPQKSNLNMNEAKFRAGKNFKIRRLIGVLLGMCMLPKRQQIMVISRQILGFTTLNNYVN